MEKQWKFNRTRIETWEDQLGDSLQSLTDSLSDPK